MMSMCVQFALMAGQGQNEEQCHLLFTHCTWHMCPLITPSNSVLRAEMLIIIFQAISKSEGNCSQTNLSIILLKVTSMLVSSAL